VSNGNEYNAESSRSHSLILSSMRSFCHFRPLHEMAARQPGIGGVALQFDAAAVFGPSHRR
jgi:hypothetical protein